MISVTMYGHSCFGIEHAEKRILIDPFLSGNPTARVGVDHFPRLDAIIVTHGHGGHIGGVHVFADRVRALGGKAPVLAVGETLSLPAAR